MFDWIGDAIDWIGDGISSLWDNTVGSAVDAITDEIWNIMFEWLFNLIYGAVADLFEFINASTSSIWFCQYHLTHFIRTRIMQRERYDHSRAFFGLPEADHRWRCRFFCWPSNS